MQVGAASTVPKPGYNSDGTLNTDQARRNKKPSFSDTLISAGTALINAHADAQVAKINAKAANKYGYTPPSYSDASYSNSDSFSGSDLLGKNGGLILGAIGVLGAVLVVMKMTAKKGRR